MKGIGEPVDDAEALRDSEAQPEAILSSLDEVVFEMDTRGICLGVWTSKDELLVVPREAMLNHRLAGLLSEEDAMRGEQVARRVLATGQPETWEHTMDVSTGTRWMQTRIALINTPEGAPKRLCVVARDITAQKDAAKERKRLLAREQLLSRLSETLPVGLFEIDNLGQVAFTNERMRTMVGQLSANTVEALASAVTPKCQPVFKGALSLAFNGQAADRVEVRMPSLTSHSPSGATDQRVCELSLRPLTDADGTPSGVVGCLSDVTDQAELRYELEIKASVDTLTSCLNREAALELLEHAADISDAPGEGAAIVFLDLDKLKAVNDTFGHAGGDRLLVAAANRLRGAARKCDSISRIGGDEFIVICPHVPDPSVAVKIATRIAEATTATIDIGTEKAELRTSVGVTWTNRPLEADVLLAQADSAMYQAKRSVHKGVVLFTAARNGDSQSPT
jgi:diguanylate cyclase (GGDEF)-like protein/PAS domain S-box-containing protein